MSSKVGARRSRDPTNEETIDAPRHAMRGLESAMIPETQTIVDMPGLPADCRLRLEEAAGGAAASASGSTDIGVAAAGTTALDV